MRVAPSIWTVANPSLDGMDGSTGESTSKMDEHNRRLQLVAETLDIADSHGLQVEVVWSALTIATEANEHDMSFDQVLEAALGEWDI